MNLLDITHRLLAGRSMAKVNQGIAREHGSQQRSTGNPYGIGGPADPNPTLPPEAYGSAGPPPGYSSSTRATGPDQFPVPDANSLPPAAQGVIPGSAYPNMPGFGGEPSVIVHQPYQDPGVPEPAPYVPPDWVLPRQGPDVTGAPPQADFGPPIDWGGMPIASLGPSYAGPGYTDPREANQMIAGLINWNGPGQANISDPEQAGMGGALAARFGLSGVQAGGVDWRRHIK